MKKHIFGFTLFSFIFASFAFAFAHLYAEPVLDKIFINKPVFEAERQKRYLKMSESSKVEVISTQFDTDEKKLISTIKMTLGAFDEVPPTFFVGTRIYSYENYSDVKKISVRDVEMNAFESANAPTDEVIFTIESAVSGSEKINGAENLYAIFDFWHFNTTDGNIKQISESSEPENVLFIHGKSSVLK